MTELAERVYEEWMRWGCGGADEFWQLSPKETEWRLDGVIDREEARWKRTAHLMEPVIAFGSKSPPGAEKIHKQICPLAGRHEDDRDESRDLTDDPRISTFSGPAAAALKEQGIRVSTED